MEQDRVITVRNKQTGRIMAASYRGHVKEEGDLYVIYDESGAVLQKFPNSQVDWWYEPERK